MTKEEFNVISPTIPAQPGCYRYFSIEGELLYVGKAKNLRKRVSSYFNKTLDNYKTHKLVATIARIEYTITNTEHDAFLLENSLIKHYQPKFNIDLKDDKSYPYIVIKKEPFPRVFLTRRLIEDGSEYLGPFTGVAQVRDLLALIRNNIPLRTCNLNLTKKNIEKGKFKVCLEYHLGNCKGPCEGHQTQDGYSEDLQHVRHILKGNVGVVANVLKKEMSELATEMEYEKAAILKQKIDALKKYQSKSTVVNQRLGTVDVVSIVSDDKQVYVNFMIVDRGSIVQTYTIKVEKKIEEEDQNVLAIIVDRLRERYNSTAKEIITPLPIAVSSDDIKVTVPRAGDKKKLLELSQKNVEIFRSEEKRKRSLLLTNKELVNKMEAIEEMQDVLQLTELPTHIECFDNSNFQGAYPVSAMVCFRDGTPSNKEYRHYHIKTVKGINDFASMSEVIYRRYKKLLEEELPMPQLVIIDGGKGQLNAALESIEKLGLTGRMTIVGLAKREESIFFPGDNTPLQLPYDSKAHLLIRYIRDEVHRFGITFHRKIRSKGTFKNELEAIEGIGEKTATDLLKEFRSVKNIKTLTQRELTRVIGQSKARLVWGYFNNTDMNGS